MPMTQDDIRANYETYWKQIDTAAGADVAGLNNSSPIDDAALYPVYEQLIRDLNLNANGAVLDVGSGTGRWVRFFTERFTPVSLTGVDFAQASVDLLRKWHGADGRLQFQQADVTQPGWDLQARFDLVNIANVLFHIPEEDRFQRALANLARHLTPGGAIVTTEYLPRNTMRTEWMLVRSRYHFEHAVKAAGLRIAAIRASSFFGTDPMGIDGPDEGSRRLFNAVRQRTQMMLQGTRDPNTLGFLTQMMADVEHAALEFCRERIADVDMPAQKLVVLRRA